MIDSKKGPRAVSKLWVIVAASVILCACMFEKPVRISRANEMIKQIQGVKEEELTPLSEAQIGDILIEKSLRVAGHWLKSQYSEVYRSDGTVLVHLDRVTRRGRFEIRDSRICTILEGDRDERLCRKVYRGPTGAIFLPLLGFGSDSLIEVTINKMGD